MKMNSQAKDGSAAQLIGNGAAGLMACANSVYKFECFDKDGNLKWTEEVPNVVTTEGKNHLLDIGFGGGTQVTTWYIGLIDALVGWTAVAAGDTAAQINGTNGWDELSEYDEANRVAFVEAAASGESMDNAASTATFTISASKTVKGAFLVSVATKDATTGVLYGAAAFTGGDRAVVDNDIIKVTITLSL